MRIGYNTNGLAHHDPLEAIDLLAELGYESIAITIDHQWLSPSMADRNTQLKAIKNRLVKYEMSSVIETGARFLLNPRIKHYPTLLEPNDQAADERIRFLHDCIQTAQSLNSDCVSLWSGIAPTTLTDDQLWNYLTCRLANVVDFAAQHQVVIGFEPEPGMFIDTLEQYRELKQRLPHPNLKMTMDVGHLQCLGEFPISDKIREWRDEIVNIHIEDMNFGIHDHLMFGEGEMNFPPIINALNEIEFQGGVHVELSRHSHNAAAIAKESMKFLFKLVHEGTQPKR